MTGDLWIRTTDKKQYFCRLLGQGRVEWIGYEERIGACLIPGNEVDGWLKQLTEMTGKKLEAVSILDDRPEPGTW